MNAPRHISDDRANLSERTLTACAALGFAGAAFTPALPSQWSRELREWLGEGKHGEMGWLGEDAEKRLDPTRVLASARTLIVVADQYASRQNDDSAPHDRARDAALSGRIARYAQGLDYHVVMRRRLHTLADALRKEHPAHEFRTFIDTAPVLEREHAARAGLGWIGKHTLLIHPSRGSYLLLGGILTSLELTMPAERQARRVADHCGSCTRCIDACPTQAITAYSVDARRCISYLTIEHRTPIDPQFHTGMGDWIFGCDICQDVCPFNQERESAARAEDRTHPAYEPRRRSLALLDVLEWNEADRVRELSGAAMKRVTLDMLKRNAIIALGNLAERDDAGVIERLKEIGASSSESEMVREVAREVAERIASAAR